MRRTRLHTLILALAFGGLVASTAEADPITPAIVNYETEGTIGGPNGGPINFEGTFGSILAPGTFNLGQFEVPVLPNSATLTYSNTPFTIEVHFSTESGDPASGLVISGLLNGTITGNNASSMFASITSVVQSSESGQLAFPLNTILVLAPQLLSPRGFQGGVTDLYAYTSFNPQGQEIPEPSTVALFGTVLVGLGVRRWRRAGR